MYPYCSVIATMTSPSSYTHLRDEQVGKHYNVWRQLDPTRGCIYNQWAGPGLETHDFAKNLKEKTGNG